MTLAPNRPQVLAQPQHIQQLPEQLHFQRHHLEQLQLDPRQRRLSGFVDSAALATAPHSGDVALDLQLELETDRDSQSLSSSPLSSHSLLSQFPSPQFSSFQHSPLSAFDPLPGLAGSGHQVPLFGFPRRTRASFSDVPAGLPGTDPMPDPLLPASCSMPKSSPRASSHYRNTSLSSLASTSPVSPYSQVTANPQIAVADSNGDLYAAGAADDVHLLGGIKPFPSMAHDSYYANYPGYNSIAIADASALAEAYPNVAPVPRSKVTRGPQTPADPDPRTTRQPRPPSVASSVTSDSPATPAAEAEEDARPSKTGKHAVVQELMESCLRGEH